jgi:hypothetical protein
MLYHVNTQKLLGGIEAGLSLCYSGDPEFKSGYGFTNLSSALFLGVKQLDCLNLENGIKKLPRNVGKQRSIYAA